MSQYTADKPHLWPDNQEVDLGDGLYGYKAVGVITAGANAEKDIIIPITGDITLVNWNSSRYTFLLFVPIYNIFALGASPVFQALLSTL